MALSSIEWTEVTWNPVTGCDRVSAGCDHCYALTLAKRLKAMGQAKYQADGDPRTSGPGFGLTLHHQVLDDPLRWRRPSVVFVNSMSDLFHPEVPVDFIHDVWSTMAAMPQHTFQILTKRPQRMAQVVGSMDWPVLPNVWLGTSVEDQRYANVRIPHLVETPAAIRFLSIEPMLGPVHLFPWLGQIDWVIVGGESGHGARYFDPNWARVILEQCAGTSTRVFVKQLGSKWSRVHGHGAAHGTDWKLWPVDLRVRDMPPIGVTART